VRLYVHETLHAKVFVVGRTAFIGSANLSARAHADETVEAAIQTTDPAIVADAREFVRELAAGATGAPAGRARQSVRPPRPAAPELVTDFWAVLWNARSSDPPRPFCRTVHQ
jgi:phosphatidylserine/phosphatidylglycerophosphate/cardiolipin synthase-like enzyme